MIVAVMTGGAVHPASVTVALQDIQATEVVIVAMTIAAMMGTVATVGVAMMGLTEAIATLTGGLLLGGRDMMTARLAPPVDADLSRDPGHQYHVALPVEVRPGNMTNHRMVSSQTVMV